VTPSTMEGEKKPSASSWVECGDHPFWWQTTPKAA